jgi:hypothetical protein
MSSAFETSLSSIKHLFQTFRLSSNIKAEMVAFTIHQPIVMRRNESTNITQPSASSVFNSGLAPRVYTLTLTTVLTHYINAEATDI